MTARTMGLSTLYLFFAASALGADPGPGTAAAAATRTLDAITIEGAVDVPQVLFITSRDNARFDDGLGWMFLRTADEILAGVTLPAVIRPAAFAKDPDPTDLSVTTTPAMPAAKEQER